jgi:hypothetical protein
MKAKTSLNKAHSLTALSTICSTAAEGWKPTCQPCGHVVIQLNQSPRSKQWHENGYSQKIKTLNM